MCRKVERLKGTGAQGRQRVEWGRVFLQRQMGKYRHATARWPKPKQTVGGPYSTYRDCVTPFWHSSLACFKNGRPYSNIHRPALKYFLAVFRAG